jgi:hypothetical protein
VNKIVVGCAAGVVFGFALNAALDFATPVEPVARQTIAELTALLVGALGWAYAKSVRARH